MNKTSGLAFICVGKKGTGKTTMSMLCLDKRPKKMACIVYDINAEYDKYYSEKFMDFDEFLEMIGDKNIRYTYILIEEATIFFTNQSNFKEMKNLLVRARHTGNIIQLNFHSFSSIPKGIYNLLDYIVIFKTNDTEKTVTDRFDNPKVLEGFNEVRQSDDFHYKKIIDLI